MAPFGALKAVRLNNANDLDNIRTLSALPTLRSTTSSRTSDSRNCLTHSELVIPTQATHLALQEASAPAHVLYEFLRGF